MYSLLQLPWITRGIPSNAESIHVQLRHIRNLPCQQVVSCVVGLAQLASYLYQQMAQTGEPGRRKSYADDLRWRIVWLKKVRELSNRTVSRLLSVSPSTVSRIVERFNRIGEVAVSIRTHAGRALDSYSEYRLLQLVCEKPTIYLREILSVLREETGMELSEATICRALKRFGYTHKKVRFVARQRSDLLRAEYKADISAFHPSMLVFVDETGCDKRLIKKIWLHFKRYNAKVSYHFIKRKEGFCNFGHFNC